MLAFNQFHFFVIPVHKRGCRQTEAKIHGHDQGDAFHGLSGLVNRRPGHGDEIRVSDGHCQTAVLGQVEHLAGQRRDNYPQGLGQDDQIQYLARFQSDGHRRFGLTVAYGLNAGPDNFSHKSRRVQHQPQQQRAELGADAEPPLEIETFQLRYAHRSRHAAQQPSHQRQTDQKGQAGAEYRERLTSQGLPFTGPATHEEDQNTSGQESKTHIFECRVGFRYRENHTPVTHEQACKRIQGLAGGRQHFIEKRVPEKQLQQDRYVLENFDICRGQLGNQPVGGQAGDTDKSPQDHRQSDADKRNQQRIEGADHQRFAIGVGRGIGNKGLADLKGGFLFNKTEAGSDGLPLEVRQRIGNEIVPQQGDHGGHADLV